MINSQPHDHGELVFTLPQAQGLVPKMFGPTVAEQTQKRIVDCGLLGDALSTVGVLGDLIISCYCMR